MNEMHADAALQYPPDVLRAGLAQFVAQVLADPTRTWNLESDRFKVWMDFQRVRATLHDWLLHGDSVGRDYARLFGLVIDELQAPPTVSRVRGRPSVEIHAVRPALRRSVGGGTSTNLVLVVTQRRDGYFDETEQATIDTPGRGRRRKPDFSYRAGATILIDPSTSEVRRVIRTPGTILDNDELGRVRRFLLGGGGYDNAFDGGLALSLRDPDRRREPFAMLHEMEAVL
jgi:hypothetical protein